MLGETVNVARRFSDLAGAGQIFISARALGKLEPDVSTKEHPSITRKRDAGKLRVFELLYEDPDAGTR